MMCSKEATVTGWQKIPDEVDTSKAPFDGKSVLIGAGAGGEFGWSDMGFWKEDTSHYWRLDKPSWVFESDTECASAKSADPTHWQPLPSPPQEKE